MKAVLDTNIIVSGLNFPGREHDILDLARIGRFELYVSPFILDEVAGVLLRKFDWDTQHVARAVRLLRAWATVVEPKRTVSVVRRDDADNRVLECALEAQADYLVTGDRRDLLPIRLFEGARIVSSAEFFATATRA
ncbi:MAG: putative toxin-antitoxin system toxin component, PIN family [Chloroflexi bacterium]|nr:putative toxin-antitoxin system toxin component, PIN family [Chloroflexota bacterium]